jgi:subtilase family serine protease
MCKKVSVEQMKLKTISCSKTQKAFMAWFLLCCMVIFSATAVFAASNSVIPDTGQTKCYDSSGVETACANTTGQDGNYSTSNQPSYSANGGMVTDAVTGLVWRQQQLTDTTYNWYEASGTLDATYNPSPAVDVCGSLTLGGLTWRLPSIKELNEITHYGASNPAIDAIFTNTKYDGSGYWSATESGLVPSNAMDIYFDDADTRIDGRDKASEANYVICVSGTQKASSFIDNGTTVSDTNLGLMWQQTDDNAQRTWAAAITYCEGLTLAGYPDWRLPNIKEIQTIVDYSLYNPAVNTTFFPGTNSVAYWSSTTDDAFNDSAWALDFSDGYVTSIGKTIGTVYTRCVRENQIDSTPPDTMITVNPTDPSTSPSASFSFTSEAGATFQCKLDSGAYVSCTSPKTYAGLTAGSHTFLVRATDLVGNTDPTPASYTWTINMNPDLVVTVLTVPTTGGAGAAISVTDTTKNSGAYSAVASTTSFYLSTDIALDGGDTLLVSTPARTVPALAAGATSTATSSLAIPLATPDGTYYIIAKADGPDLITETNETNNTKTSTALKIGTDLSVSALTVPATGMENTTIDVTDTTTNSGTGVGSSTTNFYLSTDTVLGGDILLDSRTVPALAAGTSSTASTSLLIPAGKAGTFYIIAKADGPGAITETDENNNKKVSSLIKIGGDLTVSALTVPATGTENATISVTDTTKNNTGGADVGTSTTSFYLSKDTVLTGIDSLLGSRTVGTLAPGATSSATTSDLLIPPGTAGTFYIIAKADAPGLITETNEANNTKVSSLIKIGGDLTVSALTAPATGVAGASINVTDTTMNSASGTGVGTSTTSFYLSKDTVLTGADTLLVSTPARTVPALAAGASSGPVTTSLAIPAGTAGTFYIIAKADSTDQNVETNETNNTKVSALIKMGGDLSVSALTAPATGVAGASINVTDTTMNSSSGTGVVASMTSFYLSTKNVLDGVTEIPLVSTPVRTVPALAAGASSGPVTTSLAIPAGTAGTFYIIAKADSTDQNVETNETNNTKASTLIKIGGDLTVSGLTVPATGAAGAAIAVTYTMKNIGNSDVAASKTSFYLSKDTVLTGADTLLGSRDVDALVAGASTAATSTSLTIPAGKVPGMYYIIAKADGPGAIAEASETNNTRASSAIKIGPDLIVSALTGTSTVTVGAAFNITDTTKNSGAARAAASTTSFYLSKKTVPDGTEILLVSTPTRSVPALAAGVTSMATTSLTIPSGTATGTWYIIAKADSGNLVTEANEDNNILYKLITVQP